MRRFEGFEHGINLGGWLSQFDETTKTYYDTFITEADIEKIAAMGVDHVRLPVNYVMLETESGEPKEDGYRYIDALLEWCGRAGLRTILDLHNTYGYSFDPLEEIEDREIFFRDGALQERFFALWERIAGRYGALSDRVAFELLNEVLSPAITEEWNAIADQAVTRIRCLAPDSWILIGGVRYNHVSSVALLWPPHDDRIVYNFHCYEPMVFTHQKAYWADNIPKDRTVAYPDSSDAYVRMMEEAGYPAGAAGVKEIRPCGSEINSDYFRTLFAPAVQAAEKNNAPLYCGEYGVIDRAPADSALRWLKDISAVFEEYGIARALWTYKKKDFGLVDEHYASVRDEMVKLL